MTTAFKRSICRLLMGVLLYTQMAIAAYACPGLSAVKLPEDQAAASVTPDGGAIGPVQTDASAPNLCIEHCRYGQQSADHTPAPAAPAALLSSLYALPALPETSVRTRLASGLEGPLAAASPPHAILHCCFRI